MLNRVYVVDDDEDVRQSMAFLLRSLGYESRAFASGPELLAEVAALDPGCLFVDFRMGRMTGLQLLSELRTRGIDWPVVIMTGHADLSAGVDALGMGALDFLEKPFGEETLTGVLDRAFASLPQSEGKRFG